MCTQRCEGSKGLCVCVYIPSSLAGQVVIWSCKCICSDGDSLSPEITYSTEASSVCNPASAACTLVLLPGSTSPKAWLIYTTSLWLFQALPCDSHLLMSSEIPVPLPFLRKHRCVGSPAITLSPKFHSLAEHGVFDCSNTHNRGWSVWSMKNVTPLFWKSSSFNAAKSHRTFSINHVTITLHCCQLKASSPGKAFINTSTPNSTCSGASYVGHWHVFQLNFLLGCPTILDFLCLLGPKSELLSINYFPLLPVIHKWHVIQAVDGHREQGRALHYPEPIPLQTEMNTSFSQLLNPLHQAHDLHLNLKGITKDLTNAC